jgi:alpha-D-xyloside xylohydrolase
VEYFAGRNFEKSASKTVNVKVEYTWPGPPLAEPPAGLTSLDEFSGRWQGTITAPEAGQYEIGAEADDGARLWLDGKLATEDWSVHPFRYKGARVTLQKGQKVAVKLEYFNRPRPAPCLENPEPDGQQCHCRQQCRRDLSAGWLRLV